MKKRDNKFTSIILSGFLGLLAFIILYGFPSLDVTNDAWIMQGYDESDIIQHYAGWIAFRNSDWSFPLGMAEHMGTGDGAIISFTDSIPWLAIACKAIRRFLPQTFQYFGWYTLLCYILQGIAAWKIIYHKVQNEIFAGIGTMFFCFSPILMERAFRHTALASQWFILFAIWLYMKYREEHRKRSYFYFLLLEVLAVGIHPYFLPMIFAFSLLCVIEDVWHHIYIGYIFIWTTYYYIFSRIFDRYIGILSEFFQGRIWILLYERQRPCESIQLRRV